VGREKQIRHQAEVENNVKNNRYKGYFSQPGSKKEWASSQNGISRSLKKLWQKQGAKSILMYFKS